MLDPKTSQPMPRRRPWSCYAPTAHLGSVRTLMAASPVASNTAD